MIKLVCLIQRPQTVGPEAFRDWWLGHHSKVAAKLPGLRRYVISTAGEMQAPYDGIAELWFDDVDAMRTAFDSPEGRECQREDEEFIGNRIAFATDEHIIL